MLFKYSNESCLKNPDHNKAFQRIGNMTMLWVDLSMFSDRSLNEALMGLDTDAMEEDSALLVFHELVSKPNQGVCK
jgi:hypothetical protein